MLASWICLLSDDVSIISGPIENCGFTLHCFDRYFDYIKEKYNIDDEIFDWFDFLLNGCSLFGIIPGILLKCLTPKKAAILGGIFIVIG